MAADTTDPPGLPRARDLLGPPAPVRLPVMRMHWLTLSFLHWRYPVDHVQRLLPPGLTAQPYDGSAWVGLVPFVMRVGLPYAPYLPWLSSFPETNVRTYVCDRDGRTGVWFFSLDAGRLPAVIAARAGYRLPYQWSRMRVEISPNSVRYGCRRRWPDGAGATSVVVVRPGEPIPADEITEFDVYLTARFALFGPLGAALSYSRAEHPPWPLRRATVIQLDDQLVAAAGLPAPQGDPLVHFSAGVPVRIGPPRLVRRSGRAS